MDILYTKNNRERKRSSRGQGQFPKGETLRTKTEILL